MAADSEGAGDLAGLIGVVASKVMCRHNCTSFILRRLALLWLHAFLCVVLGWGIRRSERASGRRNLAILKPIQRTSNETPPANDPPWRTASILLPLSVGRPRDTKHANSLRLSRRTKANRSTMYHRSTYFWTSLYSLDSIPTMPFTCSCCPSLHSPTHPRPFVGLTIASDLWVARLVWRTLLLGVSRFSDPRCRFLPLAAAGPARPQNENPCAEEMVMDDDDIFPISD